MIAKVVWVGIFVAVYSAYCIYRAQLGAASLRSGDDLFLAARRLPAALFVAIATTTSFSGAILSVYPALLYHGGFALAYLGLGCITVPLAGVLFLKRQRIFAGRFGFPTAPAMLGGYFDSRAVRLGAAVIALLCAVPLLALQLRLTGHLLAALADARLSVWAAMWLMAVVLLAYTMLGGAAAAARLAVPQSLLLLVGFGVLTAIVMNEGGGFDRLSRALAALAASDPLPAPRAAGHPMALAGLLWEGSWTALGVLSASVALMGLQCSPAFSHWAMATTAARGLAAQQVWASGLIVGLCLVVLAPMIGLAPYLLGFDADFAARFPELAGSAVDHLPAPVADVRQGPEILMLVPRLMALIVPVAPWVVGLLAVCALGGLQACAAGWLLGGSSALARDILAWRWAADRPLLCGRLAIAGVMAAGLALAHAPWNVLLAAGSFALASGLQAAPALVGLCFLPWLTGPGAAAGLLAGVGTAALVGPLSMLPEAWPWAPFGLHAAPLGLLVNAAVAAAVSAATQDPGTRAHRQAYHAVLQEAAPGPAQGRALIPAAWAAATAWLFFAVGPGAVIGNSLLGNPVDPTTWTLALPPIWLWQGVWWLAGVALLWLLAYRLKLSAGGRNLSEAEHVDQQHTQE